MFTVGRTDAMYGTSLQGYIRTTRARIEEVFGKPTLDHEDSFDKVLTEWIITFDNGTVATIYDWKRYEQGPVEMNETYDWHIGGRDKDAVDRVKMFIHASL